MIILGIETSCDETAISIIETAGKLGGDFRVKILANEILSQIATHQQYGGVFPMVAKREHAKNLIPLLIKTLKSSGFWKELRIMNYELWKNKNSYSQILENLRIDKKREPELWEQFEEKIPKLEKPQVDAIAVTRGPGLEPALWTGINFAKALSAVWDIPLIPINHMEGHVFASLLRKDAQISNSPNYLISKKIPTNIQYQISNIKFPALALLISGGHTELIEIKDWFDYKILGATRDDAVGEAFDKVARILGLPYPGGPQISALAEIARTNLQTYKLTNLQTNIKFPRPMLNSDNYDFSFSGIKTSVLYLVKKLESEAQKNYPRASAFSISDNPRLREEIAREFEDAVVEVLVAKTRRAILETGAKTLIVGGGVAANKLLRQKLTEMAKPEQAEIFISEISHSTDNALMIAIAASARLSILGPNIAENDFKANGNWHIDKIDK